MIRNNYNAVALKYAAVRYSTRNAASRGAAHYTTPHRVIMGEVGDWLVVCNSDAMRLVRAGYQLAA
jgi:hypothetical protein